MEPREELLAWLRLLRDRGWCFADAWPRALSYTCRGLGSASDRAMFEEGRACWQRAYDLAPPPRREAALSLLASAGWLPPPAPERPPALAEMLAARRLCGYCFRPLPERRRPQTRFCGPDHRRKAEYRRERLAALAAKPPQTLAFGGFQVGAGALQGEPLDAF